MALVIGREAMEPDATRPPLVVTVGRDDDGTFSMSLAVGGLRPIEVAALLTEAAATVAAEAGAPMAHAILSTCASAFWEIAGIKCPDCGEVH